MAYGKILASFSTFLVVVICYTSAYSQGYYPLTVGNRWDYYSTPMVDTLGFLFISRIVGDSVMPDGHTYAIMKSAPPDIYHPTRYLRQEGTNVLEFKSSGQSVAFNFAVKPFLAFSKLSRPV
jgi:hypothetical protein